jgi:hypothetical protein
MTNHRKMLKPLSKTLLKVISDGSNEPKLVDESKKLALKTNIQPSYKPLASHRRFFNTKSTGNQR